MSMTTPSYNFESDFGNFDMGSFAEDASYIVAIVFLVIIAVCLACMLANYIMESIALHTLAKRRNLSSPWLAWIPIARNWTKGAIADDQDKMTIGKDRHFRLFLLIGLGLYFVFTSSSIGHMFSVFPVMEQLMEEDTFEVIGSLMSTFVSVYGGMYAASYVYILYLAMHTIVMYKIYESVTTKLPLLFLLLSLIIPFFSSISLLCLRKKGYPEAVVEETPAIPEAVQIGWYDQN